MELQQYSLHSSVSVAYPCRHPFPKGTLAVQLELFCLLPLPLFFSISKWNFSSPVCTLTSLPRISIIFPFQSGTSAVLQVLFCLCYLHLPFPNGSAAVLHVLFCLCYLHLPFPNGSAAVLHVLFCLCYLHLPFPNGSAAVLHVLFCLCYLHLPFPNGSAAVQHILFYTACILTYLLPNATVSFPIPEWNFCSLPLSSSIPQWKCSWASL